MHNENSMYPTGYNGYENNSIYNIPAEVGGNSIPLGLGVAFSNNLQALVNFSNLPKEKQLEIIKEANELPADGDFSRFLLS